MFHIGSCTILYNPDDEVISNISTYYKCAECCVVVDNSDSKNSTSHFFKDNPQYIYIDMGGNKGIAAALNKGIEQLIACGMDYALTMDQDSKFPTADYADIQRLISCYASDFSVIGLNFNHPIVTKRDTIIPVPYWITSGNFVNTRDFVAVGKFDERLFIDYVDFEYGHKLCQHGLKIGYLEDYSLQHQIGNPIEIHLLGRTYYAMNHSPIRYYYRYRNSLYLYRQDKGFFKKLFLKEIFINIPKMLLYEKKRSSKLSMIHCGFRDARSGTLGQFNNIV